MLNRVRSDRDVPAGTMGGRSGGGRHAVEPPRSAVVPFFMQVTCPDVRPRTKVPGHLFLEGVCPGVPGRPGTLWKVSRLGCPILPKLTTLARRDPLCLTGSPGRREKDFCRTP
jgi:hypothetical protein